MFDRLVRDATPAAASAEHHIGRSGGAVIGPMLTTLARGLIFIFAFATPFVVALLVG